MTKILEVRNPVPAGVYRLSRAKPTNKSSANVSKRKIPDKANKNDSHQGKMKSEKMIRPSKIILFIGLFFVGYAFDHFNQSEFGNIYWTLEIYILKCISATALDLLNHAKNIVGN